MDNRQISGSCFGVTLSSLQEVLAEKCRGSDITWQIRPENNCIVFFLDGDTLDRRELIAGEIVAEIGPEKVHTDRRSALELAVYALKTKKYVVSGAESCTGGLVAQLLTSAAGSSEYFWGSWVCYANEAKTGALGVPEEIISTCGAVSRQTAESMAEQARLLSGSDIAYSITGIAGPGGGSAEKPVGTVWMGLNSASHSWTGRFLFEGSRESIRNQAAGTMLFNIYNFTKKME